MELSILCTICSDSVSVGPCPTLQWPHNIWGPVAPCCGEEFRTRTLAALLCPPSFWIMSSMFWLLYPRVLISSLAHLLTSPLLVWGLSPSFPPQAPPVPWHWLWLLTLLTSDENEPSPQFWPVTPLPLRISLVLASVAGSQMKCSSLWPLLSSLNGPLPAWGKWLRKPPISQWPNL